MLLALAAFSMTSTILLRLRVPKIFWMLVRVWVMQFVFELIISQGQQRHSWIYAGSLGEAKYFPRRWIVQLHHCGYGCSRVTISGREFRTAASCDLDIL